jgi:hypothetical protein
VRCQYEQILRDSRFVRLGANQWTQTTQSDDASVNPLIGSVDPVYTGDANSTNLTLSGWVLDPSAVGWPGVFSLDAVVGQSLDGAASIAEAQLGVPRSDVPLSGNNPDWAYSGFSLSVPLAELPAGPNLLTLAAHTPDHGVWLHSLQVVIPSLGSVPPRPTLQAVPASVPTPGPRLNAAIQSPQPGDQVPRSFVVQVLEPNADHLDVFLEPDRDLGGRRIGTAALTNQQASAALKATVDAPPGGHTLYVHVSSQKSGQEEVLTLPVVVRS